MKGLTVSSVCIYDNKFKLWNLCVSDYTIRLKEYVCFQAHCDLYAYSYVCK